jgi:hypothetical protein
MPDACVVEGTGNATLRGASVKLPRRRFLHLTAGAAALPAIAGFDKFITDETEKWAKVIKFANIKPE